MNNLEEKRSAMLAMIEDWRSSGKAKKQYCLENGINEAKFYYWYSRNNEKVDIPLQKGPPAGPKYPTWFRGVVRQ